jgi:DNA-binding response OmpR family regulator
MNVLIIEDDQWLAELYAKKLMQKNCQVVVAHDALTAMDQIDIQRPDIIILDLLLPASNGLAFLHELRTYEDTRHIPVIVATTVTMNPRELEGYGVSAVLDKTTMTSDSLYSAIVRSGS